jgi:hypothetical protein
VVQHKTQRPVQFEITSAAETLDGDKVLLMNGGSKHRGPYYVLSW